VSTVAPFTIRQATRADVDAVLPLLDDVDALHRSEMPWLFRPIEIANRAASLDDYFTKPDHALFVAIASDGAMAGMLYLFLRQPARAPIVRPTVIAELDCLAVAAEFRRKGVGRLLVEAALQWARAAGATRTELGVYEFNEAARAFWESVGFQTLSRRLVRHEAQT
jgi:diamine N-acetyltransferase